MYNAQTHTSILLQRFLHTWKYMVAHLTSAVPVLFLSDRVTLEFIIICVFGYIHLCASHTLFYQCLYVCLSLCEKN